MYTYSCTLSVQHVYVTRTLSSIVHGLYWRILVTRKSLTRGHVAFDTSGFFRKIAVCLDSPYLQQIASKRKMPTFAIACGTSIRRFERANYMYQLIEQLNFVQNRIFERKKKRYQGPAPESRISVLKLYTHSVNLYTHSVKLHTHRVCVHSTGT
jgi:hypothetical protein